MKEFKNMILIKDCAGNILFDGDYRDKMVDHILNKNRCYCDFEDSGMKCCECGDTGYKGDFEVFWQDNTRKDNVYEFINY